MVVTPITTSQLKTVKSNLLHHGRGLNIKSSHLTEAFAGSVGFNTQAALLVELEQENAPKVVEFEKDKFFKRLSELTGLADAELKTSEPNWPENAFTRGVAVNDLRSLSKLSGRTKARLEELFKMMSVNGVSFYQVDGSRPAHDPDGLWFGSYSPGASAMRRVFLPPTPEMWDTKSWTSLLAEDVLHDSNFTSRELVKIAQEAHGAFSLDLDLQDVVFSAEMGLYVNHATLEGCTRSVLFQRDGQLSDVLAADADYEMRAKPSTKVA